jgi:hypothetical protein
LARQAEEAMRQRIVINEFEAYLREIGSRERTLFRRGATVSRDDNDLMEMR